MQKKYPTSLSAVVATLIASAVATAARASPSNATLIAPLQTPTPAPVARTAAIEVTFASLAPATPIESSGDGHAFDAQAPSPDQPHPMIPLPPSAWAGFIGLALVARRVVRRPALGS